jgi:WD40 repeat protein
VTAFAPDGSWFGAAPPDRTQYIDHRIVVGPVESEGSVAELRGHLWPIDALAVSPNGGWLVSGSYDGEIREWDRPPPGHKGRPNPRGTYTLCAAFGPDGTWLVTTHKNGVRIVDAASGELIRVLDGRNRYRAVAVATDGAWLAASRDDGVVALWDPSTGEALDGVSIGDHGAHAMLALPGGSVAIAGKDPQVCLWRPGTGRTVMVPLPGTDHDQQTVVEALALMPDGSFACGDNDGHVHLLEPDGRCRQTLIGSAGPLFGLAVALDGTWLAAGGYDLRVRVWDLAREDPPTVLDGHRKLLSSLATSPDGHWLASCDNDGTINVWDTATWSCATTMRTHGYLHSAAWSPDGRLLAVTSGLGVYMFAFRSN